MDEAGSDDITSVTADATGRRHAIRALGAAGMTMIAALGLHGAAAESRQHRSKHRRSRNSRKVHRKEAAGSNATATQQPDSGSKASAIQAEKTDNKIGPTGPTGPIGSHRSCRTRGSER